jgi:hypothetical protein
MVPPPCTDYMGTCVVRGLDSTSQPPPGHHHVVCGAFVIGLERMLERDLLLGSCQLSEYVPIVNRLHRSISSKGKSH